MSPSSELSNRVQTAVAMVTLRLGNNDAARTELNEMLAEVWSEGDEALVELVLVLVNLSSWLLANPAQHQRDPREVLQQMALRLAVDD